MEGLAPWLRRLLRTKKGPEPRPSFPHVHARPSEREAFAGDNNDFACALYGELRQRPGNVFFSPFSIRTALGMTQLGAKGETADQIRVALRTSSSDEALDAACAEIVQRLNAAGGGEYEVAVANSLWGQDGAPLLPEFLDRIAQHYGGDMNLVDFRHAADAARVAINQWIAQRTRKKIRDLIPSGGLNAETRLVLVNAVYFKGTWMAQFRRAATRAAPFHLEVGGTVQVPLMYQREYIRYVQVAGYQAVDLVYEGADLSMLVLLPDRKGELRDLEETLSAQMLHDCVSRMYICEVKLFLPRFKSTWGTVNMRDQLTTLGMPLAFSPSQADFSGINGHPPPSENSLFISGVLHKAFVEVHEEGTEAAAATEAHMILGARPSTAPPVPIFRADHPFLFAIRERKSGAILFLGRMVDPTQES
jgi:serpin B